MSVPTKESSSLYPNGQDIRDRTFRFACRVVSFCERLYAGGGIGRMLSPQLVDCSTSVAAMLEEARGAESRRVFISKVSIALKECREAWTRLRVCETCRLGPHDEAMALVREGDELIAVIGAIVSTARRNLNAEQASARRARKPHPAGPS